MATFEPKVTVNISLSGLSGIYKPTFSALFTIVVLLYYILFMGFGRVTMNSRSNENVYGKS